MTHPLEIADIRRKVEYMDKEVKVIRKNLDTFTLATTKLISVAHTHEESKDETGSNVPKLRKDESGGAKVPSTDIQTEESLGATRIQGGSCEDRSKEEGESKEEANEIVDLSVVSRGTGCNEEIRNKSK